MNLINSSLMTAILRSQQPKAPGSNEDRLRRAGYRDGEKRPRIRHHWANR